MKSDFSNKTAIVTGGGQGIGLCIAQTFLRAGANVVIAEHNTALKPKAEAFLNTNDKLLFSTTDVSSETSILAMAEDTIRHFGQIDFLIHNAAIGFTQPIDTLTFDQWQTVLGVNLSGAFLCAKHCKEQLEKNHGAMVNIASTRALMSEANTEAYAASKGGLVALSHALSISLAPKVRVNCISPGWIEVSPWKKKQFRKMPGITEAEGRQHPVGRVGTPEDIASMVFYLISPEAGFITGANFVVDGGMTRKMIYT